MSRGEDDAAEAPPHPRETTAFFGHATAEQGLLDAYRTGRMSHAWILGGPPGIGKATLTYRMARFVLAHPDAAASAVRAAPSLALDPAHPVARQVAGQAHPDLLVLERTENDKGVLRTMIAVEQTDRTVSFFGSTAGAGGWRVCIVDSADELHPAAANKLLKVLEEPPARALFLVVSHAPGRLLPTIRSRCSRLDLRPLGEDDVARAAAAAIGADAGDADIRTAAAAADGSVGRALMLLGGETLALRQQVMALLAALPATDAKALHALGDALGGADRGPLATFTETVCDWLSARLDSEPREAGRLARVAEVWEKVNRAAREVEEFNLDRKPLVFAVFGLLAETARL
ncbi:MAG TPA: DNA polymerase III subunit delta' [Xanthobacteraceae bacterium]|nr:DNA polymerase III subunit delta' [Xanthobacteraceae bacterium]